MQQSPHPAAHTLENTLFVADLGVSYSVGDDQGGGDEAGRNELRGVRRALWEHVLRDGVLPEGWHDDADDAEDDLTEDAKDVGGGISGRSSGDDSPRARPAAAADLSDVVITVDSVEFRTHRLFLSRAEGFNAAIRYQGALSMRTLSTGGAGEDSCRTVTLRLDDISASTFSRILEFLYADVLAPLSCVEVCEALEFADAYFLSDVRPLLIAQAVSHINADTVVELFRLGELMHLQRLSAECARFAARELDGVLASRTFRDLLLESAASIVSRQAEDSVPILDDIRTANRRLFAPSVGEIASDSFARGSPHNYNLSTGGGGGACGPPHFTLSAGSGGGACGRLTPAERKRLEMNRRLALLDEVAAALGIQTVATEPSSA